MKVTAVIKDVRGRDTIELVRDLEEETISVRALRVFWGAPKVAERELLAAVDALFPGGFSGPPLVPERTEPPV